MLVARARTPAPDPAATGTAAAGIVVDAMRCRATTTDLAAASGAITADRGSGESGDDGSSRSWSWLNVEVDGRSSLPAAAAFDGSSDTGGGGSLEAAASPLVDVAG